MIDRQGVVADTYEWIEGACSHCECIGHERMTLEGSIIAVFCSIVLLS